MNIFKSHSILNRNDGNLTPRCADRAAPEGKRHGFSRLVIVEQPSELKCQDN